MLQHNFQTKAHDLNWLFDGVDTISKFMNRLYKQSLWDTARYETLNYCGDGFEFFVELFLQLHPCDNRVGVYDYVPAQENDNGVDGVGVNIRGEKCVVQVKYRSDVTRELTANVDHLSNMFSDGMLAHNVVADNEDKKNIRHFVFTTSKGLNFYTDQEMFKSKVKCFGYDDFKSMLNDNVPFWDKVREVAREITERNAAAKV